MFSPSNYTFSFLGVSPVKIIVLVFSEHYFCLETFLPVIFPAVTVDSIYFISIYIYIVWSKVQKKAQMPVQPEAKCWSNKKALEWKPRNVQMKINFSPTAISTKHINVGPQRNLNPCFSPKRWNLDRNQICLPCYVTPRWPILVSSSCKIWWHVWNVYSLFIMKSSSFCFRFCNKKVKKSTQSPWFKFISRQDIYADLKWYLGCLFVLYGRGRYLNIWGEIFRYLQKIFRYLVCLFVQDDGRKDMMGGENESI